MTKVWLSRKSLSLSQKSLKQKSTVWWRACPSALDHIGTQFYPGLDGKSVGILPGCDLQEDWQRIKMQQPKDEVCLEPRKPGGAALALSPYLNLGLERRQAEAEEAVGLRGSEAPDQAVWVLSDPQ